jgi:hypothetical protein
VFIRGSGAGNEFRRNDNSFYRGIVVKNNDPANLNRVKIYIPELSNQPYDEWFEKFENINVKFPGINNETDNWEDTKIFQEIASKLPWAEQCSPLFGESSNARYFSEEEIATLSDCNYPEGFEENNTKSISLSSGAFSPAFLYENSGTTLGDGFSNPLGNFSVKCNPYSFSYKPEKNVNKGKGIFGVPEVGAKVWVFHYMGNLNFPVYFGVTHDMRTNLLIKNADNKEKIAPHSPSDFENLI